MKKVTKIIFGLFVVLNPPLQLAAMENEHEQFKRALLQEIKAEMKDMSDMEIRQIIVVAGAF